MLPVQKMFPKKELQAGALHSRSLVVVGFAFFVFAWRRP
jgi:hypothetical protein